MKLKVALITGITGQDGSYLAELLLSKGYEVHGLVRRTSTTNTQRINHLLDDETILGQKLFLHYADLTDAMSVFRMINEIRPDEVYNLAAQSHVAVSFEEPIYTANADALGALRLLEAIRVAGLTDKTRFYQASTSEMFGKVHETPQAETTVFHPRSPYGVAKLYAHWMTVNYRESYGMFACSGILFNHESPRRGETFVTRKITLGLSRVFLGKQDVLLLGNLDAKRDWGHARDFVEMQWRMLQQEKPTDYVIATGVQYSVRDFVNAAASHVGVELKWYGSDSDEYAVIVAVDNKQISSKPGDVLVKVSKEFYRPAEVSTLLGDSSKAKAELGWQPEIGFDQLVAEMMTADFNRIACG